MKRAKSDSGGAPLQKLRYRLGDLRSQKLAEIGQELERSHKFLPGLEAPRVVIQAGPKVTCRELGKVLEEILLAGFSSIEIQRPTI
ncbi:MAG: hypothetical protein ACI8QC_001433 [Planctomycetota bacterium]